MSRCFSNVLFQQLPVIGILRGFDVEQVEHTVEAALRGGLTNIEITMNSRDAVRLIKESTQRAGELMNVGAGTVTSLELLDAALDAGASFIVTPTVREDVIQRCVSLGVPVFPGALTPTEIIRAWELGAAMVKLFPAESVGATYLRAVKGPLPFVKLLPTGGVDLRTLAEFADAGADGFGVGSPLFSRNRIESGDWNWIENQCRAFAAVWGEFRKVRQVD